MAELKQRKPGSQLSPAQRTALRNIASSPGYQKTPRLKRQSNRSLHISVSLLILAFFVVYAQQNKPAQITYSVDGIRLPKWYAVCSKEGRKVYTIPEDGGEGGVECVVVNDKRVADLGSLAKIRRRFGDKATVGAVDQAPLEVKKSGGLKIFYLRPGHTMTPGLTDSHGHPLQYGHSLQLPLSETRTKEEVIAKVEEYVLSQTDLGERWIEGMGWNQNKWPVQEFPTAADLEASPILKGLPIVLSRIDVHALWVSPAVIDLLGTLPEHVNGGQIVRDGSGRPTGVFVDNAMELVYAAAPPWTDLQREGFLGKMMDDALAVGMTGVHDAMLSEADYQFFQRMADANKLRMRFYSMVYCDDKNRYCGERVPQIRDAQDARWNVQSVKLFVDGALGSRGAALIDDYSDQPGWKGLLLKPDEVWEPLIREWYENGWQVNVHTIGDRANRIAIDAIEAVLGGKPSNRQFRLEHAQILAYPDLERAAKLGLIASYQPTHATSDMWYAEDRLGPERMKGAYSWKSYLNLGGRIALGSDFPVESIDPLKGFYAAITRLDESGESPHGPGGWYPNEKLTRLEAIRGMTVDAAYASMRNDTGSLTIGKRFDAVIWDDDLFTVVQEEILDTRVQATIIDGRVAYGSIVYV